MAGTQAQYERLLEAGLALAAELSLPAALQRIVELAAELTGARYGALGVLGRDGTISEFITTGVTEEQRAAIGHIPVGRGILGVLIDNAGPLRLRDIAEDPRSVGFPPIEGVRDAGWVRWVVTGPLEGSHAFQEVQSHLVPPVGRTPRVSRVQNAGLAPSHVGGRPFRGPRQGGTR
jgi:GAF domain-containing protein